jgi:hypothetical protein
VPGLGVNALDHYQAFIIVPGQQSNNNLVKRSKNIMPTRNVCKAVGTILSFIRNICKKEGLIIGLFSCQATVYFSEATGFCYIVCGGSVKDSIPSNFQQMICLKCC